MAKPKNKTAKKKKTRTAKKIKSAKKKVIRKVKLRKGRKPVSKRRGFAKGGKGAVLSESSILALIEKGRHRGFVTQSEVLNAFPEVEKDIKGLEMLYERLESANINIIESGRVFEEEKAKEYEEKKK